MKNVKIWIPEGKQVFYMSFRMREPGRAKPHQMKRSCGTTDRTTAQRIANQMRNRALEDFWGVPRLREDGPTCGEICDRYLKTSAVRNAREVASDFLRVAAVGAGVERNAARELSLSRLTADSMIRFRDAEKGNPTTINSVIRSARSILSARAMERYRDLRMPACVQEWRKVAFLPDKKDHSFRAIPPETLAAMDRGADMMLRLARWHQPRDSGWVPTIAKEWQNAWATYWLMRLCGMRNSEVAALRWNWFSERNGAVFIDIIDRAGEFRPKGAGGSVPIDKGLHGLLVEQFGPSNDGAYVLLGTAGDRFQGSHPRVNEFVRRYIPDRQKGAYNLRKQYGSEMAATYGIETAAKLLRHKEIRTAWLHYYDSLKLSGVKPLARS